MVDLRSLLKAPPFGLLFGVECGYKDVAKGIGSWDFVEAVEIYKVNTLAFYPLFHKEKLPSYHLEPL